MALQSGTHAGAHSETHSRATPRTVLFYKPYNVLSQFTNPDQLDCQTLKDFIDLPDLYSVGRLDRDSEGLLLLTRDGRLKHRLSHPQFQHPRTYWVQVERLPEASALEQLRQGVVIKGGYRTAPAQVERLPEQFEAETQELWPRTPPIRFRKTVPTTWLALTLTEGKNRQVRRMTAAVGHPTLRLVRSRMGLLPQLPQPSSSSQEITPKSSEGDSLGGPGWLTLRGLRPGQWRALTEAESRGLAQWVTQRQSQKSARGSKRKPSPQKARRRYPPRKRS